MKFIMLFMLTLELFANCSSDMMLSNSGAKNAIDYAKKGNHKYAVIEINEAITYSEQALDSCKGEVSNSEMKQLSKNIDSLKIIKKKILQKQEGNLNLIKEKCMKKILFWNKTRDYYVAKKLSKKEIK